MRIGFAVALSAAFLTLASPVAAAIKSRVVNYTQDGAQLQGYIAWDDAVKGKRPGVLVVHEWWGHNDHARRAADRLAQAGYVGFALDMYGKGKLAAHPKDAEAFVNEVTKDPAVLGGRFNAALALLKKDPRVDVTRLGAIGYCFGGSVVLGMMGSGADFRAVGTFHAALEYASPDSGKVKTKVLVQTGADDPMIPAEAVAAFEQKMAAAGVSARVISYPGAKHGFTNPGADKFGMPALAYHAEADKKSWDELIAFFKVEL